jgi:hypothetical protein
MFVSLAHHHKRGKIMPNDSGYDVTASKSHLNTIDHAQFVDPALHGPRPQPHQPQGSRPATDDPLQAAINAVKPPNEVGLPAARPAEAIAPYDPNSAKNRLAEEALLANPAEMRKMFPKVYNDVSLNHNGHLDDSEINQGLDNPKLPESEKNFLTVLHAGYDVFSQDVTAGITDKWELPMDMAGVSANSLALVDTEVNRGNGQDPYYAYHATHDFIWPAITYGLIGAGYMAVIERANTPTLVAGIAMGVAFGAIGDEVANLGLKITGGNDQMYDTEKAKYLSFVSDFEKS